jgi:tRNA (cmo5U34)-methyltransferase
MLDRAEQRVSEAGAISAHSYQSDIREATFPDESFDAVVAGAVMHHLRGDEEWGQVFRQIWRWLKRGGRLYVSDLVTFDDVETNALMWERYGTYLESLGGAEYREKVFQYIDEEDSPRSLPFQISCIQNAGFRTYDVLHRNSVFACYFAEK